MICVSIGRSRRKMMAKEHEVLAEQGAQLVELRLDWLVRLPKLSRLLENRPTPVVITCRREQDGGRWQGNEQQRLALLRTAIVDGADFVDLEEDTARSIPRYGTTKRIVSHHDFEGTPEDLDAIHARLCQCDPDIVKLVTTAKTAQDMVRVLKLVQTASVPTVGFCMGELGLASRILCGKYGSPFTYASFHKAREMAPGQIDFRQMKDVYRFDAIQSETTVYGVLGDPVPESPLLPSFNKSLEQQGLDAVCVPFRVPEEQQLASALDAFDWLNIQGFCVLDPHQTAIPAIASEVDSSAEQTGRGNLLCRADDGNWIAADSDVTACRRCLESGLDRETLDSETPLAGRSVLILGTEAKARAFGLAATMAGADLSISAVQSDVGARLAQELTARYVPWNDRELAEPKILVNCTAIGGATEPDELPFEMEWLDPDATVIETIVDPPSTLLLQQARQHGCRVVSGPELTSQSAMCQFNRLTGKSIAVGDLHRTGKSESESEGTMP